MRYILIAIIILQIIAYSDYRVFKAEVLKKRQTEVITTTKLPPNLGELIDEE